MRACAIVVYQREAMTILFSLQSMSHVDDGMRCVCPQVRVVFSSNRSRFGRTLIYHSLVVVAERPPGGRELF